MDQPIPYKILIVGTRGVGKTTFVKRLMHNKFCKYYIPTEKYTPHRTIDITIPTTREHARLHVYESCDYNDVNTGYAYDGIIVMYSPSNRLSYVTIPVISSSLVPVLYCSTKSDISSVLTIDIYELLSNHCTISCKTGHNVDKVIPMIIGGT